MYMNVICALIVTIFLTTMTPTPQAPTPAPATEIAVFSSRDDYTDEDLQAAAEVIERRLEALDVDYVSVNTGDTGDLGMSVQVEIVPENLTARVVELMTQPGYLELVDTSALGSSVEHVGARIWTTGQAAQLGDEAQDAEPPEGALLNPETERPFKTIIDGMEITDAEAIVDSNIGSWIVEITLSEDASAVMEDYTTDHIGEPLAIVIDGTILSMPVIQSTISSPIWLQGNFTETEARELAAQLASGPLPMTLEFTGLLSALDE
jgi:preprotein translocase subunit SecD